jgi:protoporphyrin/coproporphyrin ferrochelatase
MTAYQDSPDFRHDTAGCLGILVTNLGTPDEPTPAALRRYLAEFLADQRVIETPRYIWLPILYGVILNVRPRKSAHAYQQVWTEEGSPLLSISRQQVAKLQQTLGARCPGNVRIALGMRYGEPSIRAAMEELRAAGARRMLVLPLYPQYCGATTASTMDAVFEVMRGWRWLPELRTIMQYHDDDGYIAALKHSIESHWAAHGRGEKLLFSFHGIPKKYLLAGDPYHCQCQKTARLVSESLGLDPQQWMVTFQSRVGPTEWLQPYTDITLAELPGQGIRKVDVICPGFSADCLETLEEIAMRGRDSFIEAGGEHLSYIPALNSNNDHITALADLVLSHTRGWPETESTTDPASGEQQWKDTLERARALGASQ